MEIAAGTTPSAAGRLGTCIGTEPSPICTDGEEPGALVIAGRGEAAGIRAGGGVAGPSIGGTTAVAAETLGWGENAMPAGRPPEAGMPGGLITPTFSGSGGTAVLATAAGWLSGSGGGVGGKLSAGGATGLGAAPA